MESQTQFQPLRTLVFFVALLIAFITSYLTAPISMPYLLFSVSIGILFTLIILSGHNGKHPEPLSSVKFTAAVMVIAFGHSLSDIFFTKTIRSNFYWWIFTQHLSASLMTFLVCAAFYIWRKKRVS